MLPSEPEESNENKSYRATAGDNGVPVLTVEGDHRLDVLFAGGVSPALEARRARAKETAQAEARAKLLRQRPRGLSWQCDHCGREDYRVSEDDELGASEPCYRCDGEAEVRVML
jgi:hypothetical protein